MSTLSLCDRTYATCTPAARTVTPNVAKNLPKPEVEREMPAAATASFAYRVLPPLLPISTSTYSYQMPAAASFTYQVPPPSQPLAATSYSYQPPLPQLPPARQPWTCPTPPATPRPLPSAEQAWIRTPTPTPTHAPASSPAIQDLIDHLQVQRVEVNAYEGSQGSDPDPPEPSTPREPEYSLPVPHNHVSFSGDVSEPRVLDSG
jgi:hypothetical protein